MLIKRPEDVKSSEITDEKLYRDRRQFLKAAGLATVVSAAGLILPQGCAGPTTEASGGTAQKGPYDTDEKVNPYEDVTTYNNFYEFGVDKSDPGRNAGTLVSDDTVERYVAAGVRFLFTSWNLWVAKGARGFLERVRSAAE